MRPEDGHTFASASRPLSAINALALAVLTCASCAVFAAAMAPRGVDLTWFDDKAQHFLAFAGLAVIAARTRLATPIVVVLLTVLAAGIEIAQGTLSPFREASLADCFASVMGAAAGLLAGRAGWVTLLASAPLLAVSALGIGPAIDVLRTAALTMAAHSLG